jgi:uncharacterized protein YktA (UPF0223 family)
MLFGETMLYEAKINQNQMIQDAANYRKISQAKKEARRLKREARLLKKECFREVKLEKKAEKHIALAKKLLDGHSQTA